MNIHCEPALLQRSFCFTQSVIHAARRGNLPTLTALWRCRVNIHEKEDDALHWAAHEGHLSVVKFLLEKGASIHSQDGQAICWAAFNGHVDTVRLLLDHGADIHTNEDDALCWAAFEGFFDVVELLVERGANVTAQGCFPIKAALDRGHARIWYYLKERLPADKRSFSQNAISWPYVRAAGS